MCTMTPRASVCKRQIRVSEILKVKTFDLIQLLGLLELFLLTGFAHCIIQSCVFLFFNHCVWEAMHWMEVNRLPNQSFYLFCFVCELQTFDFWTAFETIRSCVYSAYVFLFIFTVTLACPLSCVKELSWCHGNTYGIVCCTLCLCRSLNKSTKDVETVFDLVCSSGPYAKKETNKWEAL